MTTTRAPRGGLRPGIWIPVLVVGLVGAVLVVVGLSGQQPDPPRLEEPIGTVESPDASDEPTDDEQSSPPVVTPATKVPLGPSKPTSISIPAIGVSSEVFPIGKADDGTLAVPQPGPNLDKAAWFENSPTPGQPGPSIIEGHVATDEGGPSIFFDLAELRPGDRVEVDRSDGSTVVFEVDALREFPKDEFPTELVYGGDISTPSLRLITCSNFDPGVGSHTSNLIVFTHLSRVIKG